jgi:hypothetical protein
MRFRISLAITLGGAAVGTHDLNVDAPDAEQAERDALAILRGDYDERHSIAVRRVRVVPARASERVTVKP